MVYLNVVWYVSVYFAILQEWCCTSGIRLLLVSIVRDILVPRAGCIMGTRIIWGSLAGSRVPKTLREWISLFFAHS